MPRNPGAGRSRAPAPPPVRSRILEAALALLREGGIQRLTQVQVAARAGVRQSHITYYFPTRHDLLEATTLWFVDVLAGDLTREVAGLAGDGAAKLLGRLARAVAEGPHMRMFIGLAVEADEDPALRAIMVRGTERMVAALAQALDDPGQANARAVLVATWGLGLYHFVMRPSSRNDPTESVLRWLEAGLGPRHQDQSPTARRGRSGRKAGRAP